MYESEVYIKRIKENLPQEVYREFSETYSNIIARSILHWSEHCTECSMPTCFKTCDLYSPRIDDKCQRFVNGIEKVSHINKSNLGTQILKIRFKKWGVFATQGNNELYDDTEIEKREYRDLKLAKLVHYIPQKFVKKKVIQKVYSEKKKKIIRELNTGVKVPDCFLIEVYNPSESVINLGLTIRNDEFKYSKIPFQYRIKLKPGYNKEIIPFDEISKRVRVDINYRINLIPETLKSEILLYFGITEFVQFKKKEEKSLKAKKIKCIVWDLDNTIWDGILVEDGFEKLKLKKGIKSILKQIEEKGVISSIASKNNYNIAIEALKHFGIEDFFIYPKISWLPKSNSLRGIAADLNINVNSILFVDDSIFERKEIEASLPQVRLMDAIHYQTILDLEELKAPITKESLNRKGFYVNELKRKEFSGSYEGEYLEFLSTCNIELEIEPLKEEYFERVYELTQRTNQMNFSGNRYTRADMLQIYEDNDLSTYILRCKDKFGDYGMIGFGVVNKPENELIDLMFSCRIQSKRIEHAFITHLLEHHLKLGDFWVKYKHTEKNKFSAQVFYDFDFETVKEEGALRKLKFHKDKEINNDKIITVIDLK